MGWLEAPVAKLLAHARETLSQPPNLPAVIDFILANVKPLPVVVDCVVEKRAALSKPVVVTGPQLTFRAAPNLGQLRYIVVERVFADLGACRRTQVSCNLPACDLGGGPLASVEGVALIPL